MLSYLHDFHAGNFADVLKHVVLLDVLDYLCQKEKPIRYIDTHAGGGLYAISAPNMQRLVEYRRGVLPLWSNRDDQAETLPPLERYLTALQAWNNNKTLSHYPGSPALAYYGLRGQDQLQLAELHPNTFKQLQQYTKQRFQLPLAHHQAAQLTEPTVANPQQKHKKSRSPRILTFQTNGFGHLKACLPPPNGRACILIDPAYEVKNDYKTTVSAVVAAHQRCRTGVFLIWYPITQQPFAQRLTADFAASDIPNISQIELQLHQSTSTAGMVGTGMIVINGPWNLKARLSASLDYLAKHLGERRQSRWQFQTLTDEKGTV
jgi:23S rRNA (adenine2030-N6)-methyltransferase